MSEQSAAAPEAPKAVNLSDLSPEAKAQMLIASAQREADSIRETLNKREEKYKATEAELMDYEVKLKEANKRLDALRKEKAASKPEDLDAWRSEENKRIREEIGKEIETEREKRTRLESELKELKVVSKVFSVASDKFNKDVEEDVKERIRKACDISEDGQVIVKDQKGNVRYSKTNVSKPMSIEEFIEEIAEQKPSWVNKTVVSGAMGSASTKGASAGSVRRPAEGASKAEWKAYFEANPKEADALLAGKFRR